MLKAGIFLDVENLSRNGGWGIQYDVIKELVEAQEATVLRANAYLAIDVDREKTDTEYRQKCENYRAAIRRNGFHLVLKEVKRYYNDDGEVVVKANSDLDLAVDSLLQSENLDYILLGSGDGDFLRLVRALQNRGKRVDLLSFANTNGELMREVDNYFLGFLIPGILRSDENQPTRTRGIVHVVNEDQGYGFITARTGFTADALRYDIFCHISDVTCNGTNIDNSFFANLQKKQSIVEFDLRDTPKGSQAVNVTAFEWINGKENGNDRTNRISRNEDMRNGDMRNGDMRNGDHRSNGHYNGDYSLRDRRYSNHQYDERIEDAIPPEFVDAFLD